MYSINNKVKYKYNELEIKGNMEKYSLKPSRARFICIETRRVRKYGLNKTHSESSISSISITSSSTEGVSFRPKRDELETFPCELICPKWKFLYSSTSACCCRMSNSTSTIKFRAGINLKIIKVKFDISKTPSKKKASIYKSNLHRKKIARRNPRKSAKTLFTQNFTVGLNRIPLRFGKIIQTFC